MEALAFFGGLALAVGAVLTLALKAISAERRVTDAEKHCGEQTARAERAEANATSYSTQLADMTNRHDKEKKRAEAANETIKKLLVEMATAPAAGSFRRLVSIIEAARAAESGDGDGTLHLPAGADGGSDWALLEPGQDPR